VIAMIAFRAQESDERRCESISRSCPRMLIASWTLWYPTGNLEISNWEELLDLWREFCPASSRNYAYRALPNVNRFYVNGLGPSARRSPVWYDNCAVLGSS